MRLSLRLGLILAIAAILLGTLLLSAVLTYRHAALKLDVELDSAMDAARRSIERTLAIEHSNDLTRTDISSVVSAFDGSRHVSVTHVDAAGRPIAASAPARLTIEVPGWFMGALEPKPKTVSIPLTGAALGGELLSIRAEPGHEVAEVWGDVRLHFTTLAIFCGLTLALLSALIGYALAPLHTLLHAFERIGRAELGTTVPETGAAELARLTNGFNRMSAMLADIGERNRQLDRQLETVQEEERQSLARDLHDDVGPLLFSIDVDATTIRNKARALGEEDIAERAAAISNMVSEVKEQVRAILWQLRPGILLDLGLANALESLAAFWTQRHPDVQFVIEVADEARPPEVDGTTLSVVREAVSNALRHGRPKRVVITVAPIRDGIVRATITNDGGVLGADPSRGGMGLVGMRERAELMGGSLRVADTHLGDGVLVEIQLPASIDNKGNRGLRAAVASGSVRLQ